MKIFSTISYIIGIVLVILQFIVFQVNDYAFPQLVTIDDFDFMTALAMNSGRIIGYNIFLIIGILFIIIPAVLNIREVIREIDKNEYANSDVEKIIDKTAGDACAVFVDDKCPACGYNLKLNETKCLDCGLHFD